MTNVSLLESIPENGIFLFGGVGSFILFFPLYVLFCSFIEV